MQISLQLAISDLEMPKLTQENHRVGYWKRKRGGEGSYISLTNFGMQLLKFVRPPDDRPELQDCKGFLVRVTQSTESRRGSASKVSEG